MSESFEEIEPKPELEPDSTVLYDFLGAGHYDRVLAESEQFLADDPEDYHAHNCRALALIRLDRDREAEAHVTYLLEVEPDLSLSYVTASTFYLQRKKWREAIAMAEEGQRLDPYDATFPMHLAIALGSTLKFEEAQQHLVRARELDPENPEVINLQARFSSISETSTTASLERVETLEEALRKDPGNENIHYNLGDIFLDELDDPQRAEFHFREALRCDPSDKDYQSGLFQSIARRSPLYRVISIPSRTFAWLRNLGYAIRYEPWRVIFLLFGFKFVVLFLVWLAAVTVLFWPICKVYEWLLVSEIKSGASASLGEIRAWSWFQRFPSLLRFLVFVAISLLAYCGLFWLLKIPYRSGFTFLGMFAGIHVALVFLFWTVRVIRRRFAQRKTRKAA